MILITEKDGRRSAKLLNDQVSSYINPCHREEKKLTKIGLKNAMFRLNLAGLCR